MNRSTRQWLTRRVVAAVLTFVVVFGAVIAALLLRPAAYDARIGLLAVPRTIPAETERADFGVVVANSLPALVEVAHSTSAVSSAAERVPGAPADPRAIAEGVTVELVPASGLARLTVRAGDPDVAAGLAGELANNLVRANLLSPAAALRVLDPVPTVQQASPDLPLAVGLALAAGVIAGSAVLGAAALWWPHPRRRLRRLLGEAGVGHAVAVVDDDASVGGPEELRLLRESVGRPLRLVASEPRFVATAARLSDALGLQPVSPADERRIAIGLVTHLAAGPGELRSAIGALPDPREVVAVILADPDAAPDSPGPTSEAEQDPDGEPAPLDEQSRSHEIAGSDSHPPEESEEPAEDTGEHLGGGRHASGDHEAGRHRDGDGREPGGPPAEDLVPGDVTSTPVR